MPKRRGRAPSYIPDPWSDLEWEEHPDAQRVVRDNPAGMTLEQIGATMGITRERVRQIQQTAIDKLLQNTGGDIAWLTGHASAVPIPDCRKCGEPFVRMTGRQVLCAACEALRKRKRPMIQPYAAA